MFSRIGRIYSYGWSHKQVCPSSCWPRRFAPATCRPNLAAGTDSPAGPNARHELEIGSPQHRLVERAVRQPRPEEEMSTGALCYFRASAPDRPNCFRSARSRRAPRSSKVRTQFHTDVRTSNFCGSATNTQTGDAAFLGSCCPAGTAAAACPPLLITNWRRIHNWNIIHALSWFQCKYSYRIVCKHIMLAFSPKSSCYHHHIFFEW